MKFFRAIADFFTKYGRQIGFGSAALSVLFIVVIISLRVSLMAGVSSFALILISATMLVRANDLGWRPGVFWMVRRLGFVLSGIAPWALIYIDCKSGGVTLNVYHVLFRVGVCGVFVTTPYLPPWWKWFTGLTEIKDPFWSDDRRGVPHDRRKP